MNPMRNTHGLCGQQRMLPLPDEKNLPDGCLPVSADGQPFCALEREDPQ
jgi:hypothetical protein